MADEHPQTDTQESPTAVGNQQSEVEVLKQLGIYKPGYVENFEQARKWEKGRDEKFNQWGQEIGRQRAERAITPPKPEEGDDTRPEGHQESVIDRGAVRDRVRVALRSLRADYSRFGDYEDTITEMVLTEPDYQRMVRERGMYSVMEDLYFSMRGREAHSEDMRSRQEQNLEKRRQDVGRMGEGAPRERGTTQLTPSEKIKQKLDKAAQERESLGASGFEKKHGQTFFKYTEQLKKELAESEAS